MIPCPFVLWVKEPKGSSAIPAMVLPAGHSEASTPEGSFWADAAGPAALGLHTHWMPFYRVQSNKL